MKTQKFFATAIRNTEFSGQPRTQIWGAALSELYTQNDQTFDNMQSYFDAVCNVGNDSLIYINNLDFYGTHLLSYLLTSTDLAYTPLDDDLKNGHFTYLVTGLNSIFLIRICINSIIIEFRDISKLVPLDLNPMAATFSTEPGVSTQCAEHREAGLPLTDDDKAYLLHESHVIRDTMQTMISEGHTDLTIGKCCMRDFRATMSYWDYVDNFPNIFKQEIDANIFGADNADAFVRKSYHGGWCYLSPDYKGKTLGAGITLDVNSLYPYVMHSMSGNAYPVGTPYFWTCPWIPPQAEQECCYFFVHFRTRFKIKPGKLPFVTVRDYPQYPADAPLTTTDIFNKKTGKYSNKFVDIDGTVKPAVLELTMSKTDWDLLHEQYDLYDTEILNGCYFRTESGLFDKYINKYKNIKESTTGPKRQIAKLFLNNLTGKMASRPDASYHIASIDKNDIIRYSTQTAEARSPGFIPVGSAITSYARSYIIRYAQKYHDRHQFVYSDTDSIHVLTDDILVPLHDTQLGAFKLEHRWNSARFIRLKTYFLFAEHPIYHIAGLPQSSHDILNALLADDTQSHDSIEITSYRSVLIPGGAIHVANTFTI